MATVVHKVPVFQPGQSKGSLSKVLVFALLFYCLSLIKFFTRDPLAKETGPQGPIEFVLVSVASILLLGAARRFHQRFVFTPTAWAFLVFWVLAALSSIFSFDPPLSGIKALVFLLVLTIAIVSASAYETGAIFKCLYFSVITVLLVGLLLKLASGDPLFELDEYSGRERFTLFAWDPGTLGDLCALMLLICQLLPKRPPLYLQFFLFAFNVAAGGRTSTALVVAILLWETFAATRITPRTVVLWCGIAFAAILAVGIIVQVQEELSPAVSQALESLYGVKLGEDVATLNGRTEVWEVAAPLLSRSFGLGYGFDGARDALVNNTTWAAGHSHNSILELVLTAGFPGALLFFAGWGIAAKRAWSAPTQVRNSILGLYAYIALFGTVEPNLTLLQNLSVLLILVLDIGLQTGRLGADTVGVASPQAYAHV